MHYHFFNDTPFINSFFKNVSKVGDIKNHTLVLRKELVKEGKLKHIDINNPPCELLIVDYYNLRARSKFIKRINEGDKMYIHYLDEFKASLLNTIRKKKEVIIIWNFFGGYLYSQLIRKGALKLYDSFTQTHVDQLDVPQKNYSHLLSRVYKKFFRYLYIDDQDTAIMPYIDYFYFWNKYDYLLAKEQLGLTAKFIYFRYFAGQQDIVIIDKGFYNNPNSIVLNHSASYSGNHRDLLEKLKNLGIEETKIISTVPLSYGPLENVGSLGEYVEKALPVNCNILTDFMNKNDYYSMLSSFSVGIFGHKRQEGANNVFYLLKSGVKVFLREESTLYKYLLERGYYVFSFEKDLNNLNAISEGLSEDLKHHNRSLVQEEFSNEELSKVFQLFK